MNLSFNRCNRWILFLGLLGLAVGANLSAQNAGAEGASSNSKNASRANRYDTVIRTYNIRKIYAHHLGYRIDIIDFQGRVRSIYAKNSWFSDPKQRNRNLDAFEVHASMNYINAASSNYLTLHYEDGKLISLIIYVDEPNHKKNSIWYRVDPHEDIDRKFDIKTVTFTDPPPKATTVSESTVTKDDAATEKQ